MADAIIESRTKSPLDKIPPDIIPPIVEKKFETSVSITNNNKNNKNMVFVITNLALYCMVLFGK